jgi:hypothetical protein
MKMLVEKTETYPKRLVILQNNSCEFIFSSELEKETSFCYNLPSYNPNVDIDAFAILAQYYLDQFFQSMKTGLPIILLYSNRLSLSMLQGLYNRPGPKFFENWLFVSFFNDDESLLKADFLLKPEIRLKIKEKALLETINYPFIKKISIPFGYELTVDYIEDLIEKLS